MIDRAKLFAAVRGPVFGGSLKQETVNGVNAILDEWERRGLTDLRWLAYMLATARGEVGENMQPMHERGERAYFNKYDAGTKLGKALGNVTSGDGYKFRGRGLVQLTGRENYLKMSRLTGADLVGNPDLALKPDIAAKIMFEGMIRGSFTGKKLADYFTAAKTDWVNARRIINGTDKAEQFATWARAFHAALVKADEPASAKTEKQVADVAKTGGGAGVVGIAAVGVQSGWGVLEWALAAAALVLVGAAGYGAWCWWKHRNPEQPAAEPMPVLAPAIAATSPKAKKAAKKKKPAVRKRAA